MKAKHLDRQTLPLIVLQLQYDFTLLRYLLFSNTDIVVRNSVTSPLLNPNPHPDPNPTSCAIPFASIGEPQLLRSTPVGSVGPPRTKTNSSAKVDFQPTPNTQLQTQYATTLSTTVQNLTSRICKLEKLFANETSAYISITAGIHSQYFFYMIKFASLNLATQMLSSGRSLSEVCIRLCKSGPSII